MAVQNGRSFGSGVYIAVEIYNELKNKGEDFEIVFLSWDTEEKDFEEYYVLCKDSIAGFSI